MKEMLTEILTSDSCTDEVNYEEAEVRKEIIYPFGIPIPLKRKVLVVQRVSDSEGDSDEP